MSALRLLLPLLAFGTLSACLVPLPLEPEAAPDGGQILQVSGGAPPFGTYQAMNTLEQINFRVDATSDNPKLAGRLFAQLNGSCCELNIDDKKQTVFRRNGDTTSVNSGTGPAVHYTVDFQREQPCTLGFSGSIVYIVPVLTTEGFADGLTGFRPEALGTVDRTHNWAIICP